MTRWIEGTVTFRYRHDDGADLRPGEPGNDRPRLLHLVDAIVEPWEGDKFALSGWRVVHEDDEPAGELAYLLLVGASANPGLGVNARWSELADVVASVLRVLATDRGAAELQLGGSQVVALRQLARDVQVLGRSGALDPWAKGAGGLAEEGEGG